MLSLLAVQEGLRQRSASSRCLYFPLKHFKSHFSCTILGHEMSSGVQPEPEPLQPVNLCSLLSAWRYRRRGNSKAPGPRSSELNAGSYLNPRMATWSRGHYTLPAQICCTLTELTPLINAFLLALGLPASWDPGTAYTLVGTNLAF